MVFGSVPFSSFSLLDQIVLDLNLCILPWVYSETVNFIVGHQSANSSSIPWIYGPERIIKVMNVRLTVSSNKLYSSFMSW